MSRLIPPERISLVNMVAILGDDAPEGLGRRAYNCQIWLNISGERLDLNTTSGGFWFTLNCRTGIILRFIYTLVRGWNVCCGLLKKPSRLMMFCWYRVTRT